MRIFFLATLCVGLMGGCVRLEPKGNPTRFFVLSPPTREGDSSLSPAIAINHVSLPDYLQRAALAVRRGANEIIYADDFEWAEPLDRGMWRVLNETWRRAGPKAEQPAQLDLFVRRFDVDLNGEVTLQLDWARTGGSDFNNLKVTSSGPGPAEDPAGAVDAMSRALEMMSQRIAEGVWPPGFSRQ